MSHTEFFRGMDEYEENYERGHADGYNGEDYDPPFGAPAAVAGYRDGYEDGIDQYTAEASEFI